MADVCRKRLRISPEEVRIIQSLQAKHGSIFITEAALAYCEDFERECVSLFRRYADDALIGAWFWGSDICYLLPHMSTGGSRIWEEVCTPKTRFVQVPWRDLECVNTGNTSHNK